MAHFSRGNSQGNPFAAAAEIEPEHEPRLVDRAAAMARAQAEAAVKAMHRDVLPLDVMKERIPDERAVTEEPQVILRIPAGEDRFERGVEVRFRER